MRATRVVNALAAASLLAWTGFLSLVVAARLLLGHWPRAVIDDPKFIGLNPVHYEGAGLCLVVAIILSGFTVGCGLVAAAVAREKRTEIGFVAALTLSLAVSFCVLSPYVRWYLD